MRDQGYLESLSRPNVRLTFDKITHIIPDGVVTETGLFVSFTSRQCLTYFSCLEHEVDLDVIIYSTGFVTVRTVRLRQRHSNLSACLTGRLSFERTWDKGHAEGIQ